MLTNKRVLARLRSSYPLMFYVPGFLLGQITVLVDPLYWCILGGFFILCMIRHLLLWPLSFAFVLGGALTFAPELLREEGEFSPEISYVAEVNAIPRYKRVGEIEVSLRLIGSYQAEEIIPISQDWSLARLLLCKAADLPWHNINKVREGSRIVFRAKFREIPKEGELLSYFAKLRRVGYHSTCKIQFVALLESSGETKIAALREAIGSRVRELLGNGEKSGLVLSMSIGTRDTLSIRTERAFKRTGLAHLLIVSGYQVTLIFLTVVAFTRYLGSFSPLVLQRVNVLILGQTIGALAATAYVLLTGCDPSSLRAELALIFVIMGCLLERGKGMFHAILASLLVLSVISPGAILDPGVQLTYSALLGICTGVFQGRREKSSLQTFLLINFYASLFTSFVVLCWFNQFSFLSFVLNPALSPLVSFIGCKASLLAIAINGLGIDPGGVLLQVIGSFLIGFRDLVLFFSEQEVAAVALRGTWKYISLALLSCTILRILWLQFYEYLLSENVLG